MYLRCLWPNKKNKTFINLFSMKWEKMTCFFLLLLPENLKNSVLSELNFFECLVRKELNNFSQNCWSQNHRMAAAGRDLKTFSSPAMGKVPTHKIRLLKAPSCWAHSPDTVLLNLSRLMTLYKESPRKKLGGNGS